MNNIFNQIRPGNFWATQVSTWKTGFRLKFAFWNIQKSSFNSAVKTWKFRLAQETLTLGLQAKLTSVGCNFGPKISLKMLKMLRKLKLTTGSFKYRLNVKFPPLLGRMGGAAFDPLTPTLIKILNFSYFHQKEHKKLGVYSYSRQRKKLLWKRDREF